MHYTSRNCSGTASLPLVRTMLSGAHDFACAPEYFEMAGVELRWRAEPSKTKDHRLGPGGTFSTTTILP